VTSKDRLLLNGQRILRVLREFSFESSGDVSINYIINNDGDETIYTMWSVRKIMDNLKGVVNSTAWVHIYVDADDGDDNNDGSESSPLKSIKQAIEGNCNGSVLYIHCKRGQTHKLNTSDEYHVIPTDAQSITLTDYGDSDDDRPLITSDAFIYDGDEDHTSLLSRIENWRGGSIWLEDVDVKYPAIIDGKPYNDGSFQSQMFLANPATSIGAYHCKVDLSEADNASFFSVSRYRGLPTISLYYVDFVMGTDTRAIGNRTNSPISIELGGNTWKDADGNSVDQQEYAIRNIVRDADSGNPVNINSNVNFSD